VALGVAVALAVEVALAVALGVALVLGVAVGLASLAAKSWVEALGLALAVELVLVDGEGELVDDGLADPLAVGDGEVLGVSVDVAVYGSSR
jgi:hypothetical protein